MAAVMAEDQAVVEAQSEALGREVAGLRAECSQLRTTLGVKDSALAALRRALARQEQVLAAEDPTTSSSAEEAGRLAAQLAAAVESQARCAQELKAAAQREVDLRLRAERLERKAAQLRFTLKERAKEAKGTQQEEKEVQPGAPHLHNSQRAGQGNGRSAGSSGSTSIRTGWEDELPPPRGGLFSPAPGGGGGGGKGEEDLSFSSLMDQLSDAPPRGEGLAQLRRRVVDQAAVIRHLELRVAEITAASDDPYGHLTMHLKDHEETGRLDKMNKELADLNEENLKLRKQIEDQDALAERLRAQLDEGRSSAVPAAGSPGPAQQRPSPPRLQLGVAREDAEVARGGVDREESLVYSPITPFRGIKTEGTQSRQPSAFGKQQGQGEDNEVRPLPGSGGRKTPRPSDRRSWPDAAGVPELLEAYGQSLEELRALQRGLGDLLAAQGHQQDRGYQAQQAGSPPARVAGNASGSEGERLGLDLQVLREMFAKLQSSIERLEEIRLAYEPLASRHDQEKGQQELLGELSVLRERMSTLQDMVRAKDKEGSTNMRDQDQSMVVLFGELRDQIGQLQSIQQEKAALEEEVLQLRTELVCERKAHWDASQALKEKYEHTISKLEAALDQQRTGMEREIRKLQVQMSDMEQQQSNNNETHELVSKAALARLRANAEATSERAERASKELKAQRRKWDSERRRHLDHVDGLRAQMAAAREAQDRLLDTLQEQLRRARGDQARDGALAREEAGGMVEDLMGRLAQRDGALAQAEAQTQQAVFDHKCKVAELEAALAMLDLDAEARQQGEPGPSRASVTEAVLGAKLAVLEREVARLNLEAVERGEELCQLRRDRLAERQARRLAAAEEPGAGAKGGGRGEGKAAATTAGLRAELRRAKAEGARLRAQLGRRQVEEQEREGLQASLKSSSSSLQLMREDNQRKSKLIAQIRAAKALDEELVDKLKLEIGTLETKLEKSKKDLTQKMELVKTLKARLSQQREREPNIQKESEELALQKRLWDAEKNRYKNTIQSLKDKIKVHEDQIEQLAKGESQSKGVKNKLGQLRAELKKTQQELLQRSQELGRANELLRTSERDAQEREEEARGAKTDSDEEVQKLHHDLKNVKELLEGKQKELEITKTLVLDSYNEVFNTTLSVLKRQQLAQRTRARRRAQELREALRKSGGDTGTDTFFSMVQEGSSISVQAELEAVAPVASMLNMSAEEVRSLLRSDGEDSNEEGDEEMGSRLDKENEAARAEFTERIEGYLMGPAAGAATGLAEILSHLLRRLVVAEGGAEQRS